MRDPNWQRRAALKRIAKPLQFACWFCGAAIAEPCRTKNGRELLSIGMMHNARITPDKKLTKSYVRKYAPPPSRNYRPATPATQQEE